MKEKIIFLLGLLCGALICMGLSCGLKKESTVEEEKAEAVVTPQQLSQEEIDTIERVIKSEATYQSKPEQKEASVDEIVEPEEETQEVAFYLNELMYLAQCVEAEAGNQDLLGKRLVVDVVLNRVDSPDFPDDIISVINQKNQFSVVANGMIDIVEPRESTWEAIYLELENRSDSQILFFRSGHAHSFCEHNYQHGDHYFGY